MKNIIILLLLLLSFSVYGVKDIGAIRIENPCGITDISGPIQVDIWIKNYGTTTIDTIPLVFLINNSPYFYDTLNIVNGLISGDSILVTSSKSYNSPIGFYQVCVTTQLVGDIDSTNNSACAVIYGSYGGQPMDLCITDIRPTINIPGAGNWEIFEIKVRNSGMKEIDTVNVSVIYTVGNSSSASFPLAQTLFPDSSVWVRVNYGYKKNIGVNEAKISINDPSDVNPYNDTASYTFYGARRIFDLSVDSIICNPSIGDTVLSSNVDLKIFYSNQGLQPLNHIFSFVVYDENHDPYDTVVKNIVLQPTRIDSIEVQEYISPSSTYSNIIIGTIELDSNGFNDVAMRSYYFIPTSIVKINNLSYIKPIYPNPASNKVTIEFTNNTFENVDAILKVYTITGKLVYQSNFNTDKSFEELSVDMLKNGVYIYQVSLSNGIEQSGKLVILKN